MRNHGTSGKNTPGYYKKKDKIILSITDQNRDNMFKVPRTGPSI